MAELFQPGAPGDVVLSELIADAADGATGAQCPPGTPITQWRRDLKLVKMVLPSPEAAEITSRMASEFQILLADAASIRAAMHLL